MLVLHEPRLDELAFRQRLLADEATMTYNEAYGGTIAFPEERWKNWHQRWVASHSPAFFYRYLKKSQTEEFVGEVAYHFDEESQHYLCDVIIFSPYRGQGFGDQGLKLLIQAATVNQLTTLFDHLAPGNPAVSLFLKNGFTIENETTEGTLVKRVL